MSIKSLHRFCEMLHVFIVEHSVKRTAIGGVIWIIPQPEVHIGEEADIEQLLLLLQQLWQADQPNGSEEWLENGVHLEL